MAPLSKRSRAQAEQLFLEVFDKQDCEMIVARAAECELLLANEPARAHIEDPLWETRDCKGGYASRFKGMCGKCPGLEEADMLGRQITFDVKDADGRTYAASCHTLEWLDGKPATVWFLRDMDEIRHAEQKLYKLAYVDHLTGIPNRQRLREDFDVLEEEIENGKKRGLLAIFDLDNFKSVNDTYGHNTGDVLLRRLAEHIDLDPNFHGHIYRLGGDEFVLLFSERNNAMVSDAEYRAKFEELLQGVLLSYTLPNIELACTVSMGVAFFPQHGSNFSELLRKADIALYKAKEGGRDQVSFFEDQYDSAKKLKDVYISIQPVLNAPGRTFGYELVDRGEEGKGEEGELNLNQFDHATDALGLEDIENEARYFLTYTEQLHNPAVRNNLPKDKFIIHIKLPDTCKEAHIKLYGQLRGYGYSLLMSNIHKGNALPAALVFAEYCKFAPGGMPEQAQDKLIAGYKSKKFIATDVNTPAAFARAKERGFKLFQGFYFNTPEVTTVTKEIDPLKVNYYRLLKLTSTNDFVDFREISEIISSDVALSYKLLRLLNSAAVGLRYRVSSIHMAVAYLGEENLKKWIALLALRGVASDKPPELMRMSMIRAQFGELLAPHFRPRRDPKHVFLIGMFSLLHIAMDKSKEELLNEIPVADEIRESLLTKDGIYSDMIPFYSNYEYANWDEVNRFADENGLSYQVITDCYIAAVKWYNELVSE